MWKKEPDVVFENLKRTRVMVKLEGRDWDTAITAIGDVLKKIKEDAKRSVLLSIAHAVQQELYKSKEIDVETMKNVASYYPLCVEVDDDNLDEDWITAYDDVKLSPDTDTDAEEGKGDDPDDDEEEGEDEDADGGLDFAYLDEDADGGLDFAYLDEDDAIYKILKKRANTDPEEFKEAGMKELKKRCDSMGCSLKQGQDQEILGVMISFFREQKFRIYHECRMKTCVEAFMSRVKGYISSTCILNDPTTVLKAVQSVEKTIRADAYAVQAYQQQVMPRLNLTAIEPFVC
ncbi:hypothetical protein ACLB2K_057675 [Fragaria x ananassa]